MNKKAGRYIKPEKLKNFLDNNNKEDLTPPVKRDSISTAEKQQQKNKIELRVQNVNDENSKISENNRQESFADSSDDEEEDDDNQVSQSDKKSQYHHNPSRVQTLATVQPRSDRAAASIGRHRASTFDPKTLKRMMVGKVESLKPDDQIELAIIILQKEFEERTPTDIKFLVKCTENVGFFKKYDEETHRECLAKMYHVHLKQGDPCISFGEFGETFWVTLKGKVGILVPIEKEITDKNGEVRKEKVLTRVAGQGAGYAFGELALLERKPRAATILCEDDCDFAVLDKTPFQQILLQKEEKRLFAEVNFLKNIKIFSQWAYNSIRSLFMYSQMKTYTRGQVVCRQSDPADCMFIIRAGEFKVSYKAHYETKEGEVLSPEHGIVNKYMKKKAATRDVELSILGPSEIIGVEDLLEDRPRSHTVVCESQTALILQIHKKEAKNLIFNEASAKVWLKEYLESKSKVQGNRIEHIHQNTRKFQPLLMRTASEGSKKSNDFNYKSPFGDQATELSNALRYYRHKRPENHQITQTLNSQREDSPPRTFESNLHTEPTDHHGKDSNRLKLPQDGWSSADRYSLLESTVQATESITGSALLSQPVRTSPHKRSATQPVDLNKGREEEQGSFRLSITEKVFKEYNDSIKLHRSNKEDRFANLISKPMPLLPHRLGESRLTDLINTSTDSRSRAGRLRESIGREDHIKNISTLSYSSSTSKLELVVTNSAEKPLISKSFHLKLHQAFPALPTNRMSLDSKITAQTSRFHPRTDLETSKNHEYYMKSRKELIDRIAEIKERLDFRDQIDQDLFLFSKRNLRGGTGQTLYNRAIISSFCTNQPEKQDSPISLRLRDRLNKIQKNAKSKNAANTELPEKVEPVNQNASSIILKANLIHGTKTDPDSARTPPKGRPTFKQQNSDIQSIKVVGQATNSNSLKLNLKSDMETPIKVTDRFFPLIENRDSN